MNEADSLFYNIFFTVFFCIGFFGLLNEIRIRITWTKVDGVFIRMANKTSISSSEYSGVTPIIEYQTTEGLVRSHTNFYRPEIFCSYSYRQKIIVYYNPKRVKAIRIKGDKLPILVFFIFLGVSLVTRIIMVYSR